MFEVYKKASPKGEPFTVYDVRCDNTGYPHFLIYNPDHKAWEYHSAKEFVPTEWKHIFY